MSGADRERRVLLVCGSVIAGALLVAFLSMPYLPMVDLPQHAAQIAIWLALDDPGSSEARHFAVNLRTPYITAYFLARWLAGAIGLLPALKIVVWTSVVAHWLAFGALARRLGHPGWLAILGLPLACGYCFYFGFVSFLVALPLSFLAIVAALDHREAPGWKSSALLAALLAVLLATHGFALGVTLFFVVPLLLRGTGGPLRGLLPLVAPAALWAVWLMPARSVRSIGATLWEPRLVELLHAPALLVSSSGADRVALGFGYALLGLLVFALGRPSRALERLLPLALVILGFCLFPLMLSGFGPLHPRFAAYLVPALLLAFEPKREPGPEPLMAFGIGFSFLWFGLFAQRLAAFAEEVRPVVAFVEQSPPSLRVRPVVFERDSRAFPGLPALLHLPAYYAAVKGGRQGYSFAMYPTSVIRYQPSVMPPMGGGSEWHPERFAADSELDAYDCVLVHSSVDPSSLFGRRAGDVRLEFADGSWWAYRVVAQRTATASPWPS